MARVLVLGPVRVGLPDGEVVPGGPRERGVLAALALAGEAGVDHHRLVDLVWGESAPRTAHRTAQAYLSRLRGLLGPESLQTTAGRHRLVGVSVDLWDFEELLLGARRAPATAPRLLRDALALWRDRAVAADAALDGGADLVSAWEAGRLDAQELLLVHLTDPEVPEAAERLLVEAPHRERAWGLLAAALHRLGRQDEALAAVRRARRRLADDLGIDPSPELEALEQDLLHQRVAPGDVPPLPRPATRLVGRQREVERVVAGLAGHRLVTLLGTGGIGKTRLALAVADQLTREAPVFVARLAAATSSRSAHDAVVEALDAGVTDLADAAARRFGRGPGYLVLDNCEHVLPAAADVVGRLLSGPYRVRVLATSRTPLGVAGELLVDVPPLPFHDDTAGHGPAVDLFLERAAEVTDTSQWGPHELAAAADVCRSLAGIPLALELAARRLRTLEVTELLDDLHADLRLDPVAAHLGDDRHRTLATALDWSYRALPADQQRAFRLLGLLHGALPLAGAATVAGGRARVEGLLQQSLLVRTRVGVGMYEPVRQYATALLSPEERREGLARIADEVATFTARAADRLVGPDEVDWLDRLDALHGDIRAVLAWAAAHGRHELLAGVVADVAYLWMLGWSPGEGRYWLDTAASATTEPRQRARLLAWSSGLATVTGDPELAREHGAAAVALARDLDEPRLLARALHALALPDKYGAGTARARELLAEAHALRLRAGDLAGAAMSLGAVADIDVNESLFDRAAEGYALGLPLMRAAGTARGLVAYLHSMAELELMRGDPARADELAREAEEPARRTRDAWHVGQLASVRAAAARDLGRPAEEQRALTRAALEASSSLADPKILLDVIEHVAGHLADQGRWEDALRLLVGAAGVRRGTEAPWSVPRRARRDADEQEALRHVSLPDLGVQVDLAWLTAVAGEALR